MVIAFCFYQFFIGCLWAEILTTKVCWKSVKSRRVLERAVWRGLKAHPFKRPSLLISPYPYPYVPPHINNRYINIYNARLILKMRDIFFFGRQTKKSHVPNFQNQQCIGIFMSRICKRLSCILLSYAAPFWPTLHPIWAWLSPKRYAEPSELGYSLLRYAASFWATLHPSELCCTLLS